MPIRTNPPDADGASLCGSGCRSAPSMCPDMADEQHDDPEQANAQPDVPSAATQGDSSFEAAQQLLQDAVAEFRNTSSASSASPGDEDGTGGHRRWRRRIVTDADPAWPAPERRDDGRAEALTAAAFADAEAEVRSDTDVEVDTEVETAAAGATAVADTDTAPAVDASEAVEAQAVDVVDDDEISPDPELTAEIDTDMLVADDGAEQETPSDEAVSPEEEAAAALALIAAAATVAQGGAADDVAVPANGSDTPARRRRRRAREAADAKAEDDLTTDLYEPRVPKRRRAEAGAPQTVAAPTAEYVLDDGEPMAVGIQVESTDEPASTPQRGRRVLVACVAAVVAIGVIAFVVASSGSDDEVATPTANVQPRFEFPPVTTPEGATVTRAWKLTGTKGSQLDGKLTVENPTSKSVTTTFTEVIPKSLASSVDQITFDPQPVVVKADPIVRYTATVAPGTTFVATYTIEVEPLGRTRQRLLTWADDLAKETGTTTTTVPPTTTTAPASTTPSTTPAVTTPTTTGPPATTTTAPPADGSIWIAISNTDANAPDTTFTFSDGTSVVAPHGGLQGSSPYITVSPGVHSITLLNGTATSITCSGRSSGSGNTATYDVAPGEQYVGCTWTASSP